MLIKDAFRIVKSDWHSDSTASTCDACSDIYIWQVHDALLCDDAEYRMLDRTIEFLRDITSARPPAVYAKPLGLFRLSSTDQKADTDCCCNDTKTMATVQRLTSLTVDVSGFTSQAAKEVASWLMLQMKESYSVMSVGVCKSGPVDSQMQQLRDLAMVRNKCPLSAEVRPKNATTGMCPEHSDSWFLAVGEPFPGLSVGISSTQGAPRWRPCTVEQGAELHMDQCCCYVGPKLCSGGNNADCSAVLPGASPTNPDGGTECCGPNGLPDAAAGYCAGSSGSCF
jgi:hypothetical protein